METQAVDFHVRIERSILHALLFGIVSGVAVAGIVFWFNLYSEYTYLENFLTAYAGFVYGIFTVPFIVNLLRTQGIFRKIASTFMWIICSGVSYVLAVHVLMSLADLHSLFKPAQVGLAGVVGSLILCIGFRVIFGALNRRYLLLALVAGAFLPQAVFVSVIAPVEELGYYLMFIMWQTGITALLAKSYQAR